MSHNNITMTPKAIRGTTWSKISDQFKAAPSCGDECWVLHTLCDCWMFPSFGPSNRIGDAHNQRAAAALVA